MSDELTISKEQLAKAVESAVTSYVTIAINQHSWPGLDTKIKELLGGVLNSGRASNQVEWAIEQGISSAIAEAIEESDIKAHLKAEIKKYLETDEFRNEALALMKQQALANVAGGKFS